MSSAAAVDRGLPGPAPLPARPAPPRTLLLGMGNPILCDDGVGHELARRIAAGLGAARISSSSRSARSVVSTCSSWSRDSTSSIVIDSIKTRGGRPGDWYRFGGASLHDTMNLSNVHDANFATAMELGRRMGMHVPAESDIHVFAVEVQENLTFDEHLSPKLESAVSGICEEMLGEVEDILAADRPQ